MTLGDDAARAQPNLGRTIRSRIQSLSDDETVREATYGLAWDVMCDVATSEFPRSLEEIVGYVAAGAADFGIQFADEGAQIVGEAIVDELDGQESEVREACGNLQP